MGDTITLDPTTEKMFLDFLCKECGNSSPAFGSELSLLPTKPKHSELQDRFNTVFKHLSVDPLGVKFTVRYRGRPLDVSVGLDADYSLSKDPIDIKGFKLKIGF